MYKIIKKKNFSNVWEESFHKNPQNILKGI